MYRPSTHPGKFLLEDLVKPYGLNQTMIADLLGMGVKTVSEIYNKKRKITPAMALKFARYFGTTPEFWLNAQNAYDLYFSYDELKEDLWKIRKAKVRVKKKQPYYI